MLRKAPGKIDPERVADAVRGAADKVGGRFRGLGLLKVIVALIVAALVVRTLAGSMVAVGAGERAVVFSKVSGVLHTQLGEGYHLMIPWVWKAALYDVRRHTWTISIGEKQPQAGQAAPEPELTALTKDGQQVTLDESVSFHLDPDYVWRLHQRVGPDYLDKVIRPETRSTCRMVVSQYAVTEVYSGKREEIQARIQEELSAKLKAWDIILDEVLLRNVQFSKEFQAAIEAKQVAIQEYERMQYVLQSADKTREKTVVQAEGEAESMRLQGEALRANPLALSYTYARKVGPKVGAIITSRATTPPAAGGR